jgi:cell wall assembly regulator SMI1
MEFLTLPSNGGDGIWDRFESMLTEHAPDLLASLRLPATEAQIDAAESKLGVQFPAEIRRAYLRHNPPASD